MGSRGILSSRALFLRRIITDDGVAIVLDILGPEIKVEKLGVGEDGKIVVDECVAVGTMVVLAGGGGGGGGGSGGEFVGGRDGVEIGNVLRHIGSPTTTAVVEACHWRGGARQQADRSAFGRRSGGI